MIALIALTIVAVSLLHPCNLEAPEIKTIIRPFDATRPEAGRFAYRFKLVAGEPGHPTIVYLPGGPGGFSSMSDAMSRGALGLPASFPAVLTDQRGDGCNSLAIPPASLTTPLFADDIVALVRDLGLKDYILYGHSYGTLHATVAAHALAAAGMPPRAVVLEGVLGRAYQGDEPARAVADEWREVVAELTPAARALFLDATAAAPLAERGVTAVNWGTYIQGALYAGHAPLVAKLDLLPLMSAAERDAFAAFLRPKIPLWPPFFATIACREFAHGFFSTLRLERGDLLAENDLCDLAAVALGTDLAYGVNEFDAARFQLTMPLYYFNGDDDAATPLYQAHYHEAAQAHARRTFVIVHGAGHLPLKTELKPCREPLWDAIAAGEPDLTAALALCPAQSTPTVTNPSR